MPGASCELGTGRMETGTMEEVHDSGSARNSRRHLPDRRGAIALNLEHGGHHFRLHVGRYPDDGSLGEVFIDAAKQNSALDAFAADAAILVSLLLQHGASPAEIGHALRRAPDGTAASLVGAVVDRLVEMGRPQS
jgi:hypothetical protein